MKARLILVQVAVTVVLLAVSVPFYLRYAADDEGPVAISPNGATMAIGRDSGSVPLWSLRDKTVVGRPLLGLDSYVYRVVFGPGGGFPVGGSQRATVFWNPETGGQVLPAFPGGSGLALSPDGRTLALFDHDNPVLRLYETGFRR